MKDIIGTIFSNYLSEQTIAAEPNYSALTKRAFQKETELRQRLDEEQTRLFEELFELTSQIHFLEVKDAFFCACKWGAKASKELII